MVLSSFASASLSDLNDKTYIHYSMEISVLTDDAKGLNGTNRFEPDRPITRAEAAKIIVKLMQYYNPDMLYPYFNYYPGYPNLPEYCYPYYY